MAATSMGGDGSRARRILARWSTLARGRALADDLSASACARSSRSVAATWSRRPARPRSGSRLARETGQETWLAFASAGRVTVLAGRSRRAQARALADEGSRRSPRRRPAASPSTCTRRPGSPRCSTAANDEAAVQARRAVELERDERPGHPAAALWAATPIDALVLAGRHDAARETIDWLAAASRRDRLARAAGVAARGELIARPMRGRRARRGGGWLAAGRRLEMPAWSGRARSWRRRARCAARQRRGDARAAGAGAGRLRAARARSAAATRSRIGLEAAPPLSRRQRC